VHVALTRVQRALDLIGAQVNALLSDYSGKAAELTRGGADAETERRIFTDFHLAPHKLQSEAAAILERIRAQQISAANDGAAQ
jgi:hypothetical protein